MLESMRLTRHGDSTFVITDQFTVLWIESGVVDMLVNGERIKLDSKEGLMLTAGQSYVVQRMSESSQIVILRFDPYELFHPEMAERYVKSYDTLDKSIHILKKEWTPRSIIQTIERAVQHIQSDGPLGMLDATLQCTVIWRYWIQQEGLQTKPLKKLESLQNMIACVHAQLEEKVSLTQIAAAGQISRSECCRLFKRFGDTSPLAYVQLKRMERAITLLEDSSESIADIANRLSYSSVSHFVQTFKAHHTITPLAYRKKYQTKRAE